MMAIDLKVHQARLCELFLHFFCLALETGLIKLFTDVGLDASGEDSELSYWQRR
ncbi:MAG: hypothetical protein ACOH2R_09615 [Pseudomonas sp.]